jgi:hypothetical protein
MLSGAIPTGAERPCLALPIFADERVVAVVIYGAHQAGTAIDPDEIRALHGLTTEAGFVFRHLDALAKQQGAAALERQLVQDRGGPAPQPA